MSSNNSFHLQKKIKLLFQFHIAVLMGGGREVGKTFALAIFQTNCKRTEKGNKIAIESQESLKGFEILYIHAHSSGDFFVMGA